MNIARVAWAVASEPAAFKQFYDTNRLRVMRLAVFGSFWNSDHLGVATQEDVGFGRIDRLTDAFFQFAAAKQILNVHLVLQIFPFAGCQHDVTIVGHSSDYLLMRGQITEIAPKSNADDRSDQPA